MNPQDHTARRIPELDGLRGLAILLVIITHYLSNPLHGHPPRFIHYALNALSIGWSGVDLFFVLSGFLIGGILLDARESSNYFRVFYLRRAYRILPVYYLWTLLFGLVAGIALAWPFNSLSLTARDLLQVPLHLLFLQNFQFGMSPFVWAWFIVTWSLAVEEQFYLVAPPLIRFLDISRLRVVLVSCIGLAPIIRVLVFTRLFPNTVAVQFLTPCRADSLAAGILLALAWRHPGVRHYLRTRESLLRGAFLVLFIGVGVLAWWLAHPLNLVTISIGYSWLAAFYACLLLLVVSQTPSWLAAIFRWRLLRELGAISYCVYILHHAFNNLAHRLLLHGPPEIFDFRGIGVSLLALGLTITVARLSWRFLEKPLIARGHLYNYHQPPVLASTPVSGEALSLNNG